jgi:hypothetical protein
MRLEKSFVGMLDLAERRRFLALLREQVCSRLRRRERASMAQ